MLIIGTGASPWTVWHKLVDASLGSTYGVGQVLFRPTSLALTPPVHVDAFRAIRARPLPTCAASLDA